MTDIDKINDYLFKKYNKLVPIIQCPHPFLRHDSQNDNSIDILKVIRKYSRDSNGFIISRDIENMYEKFVLQTSCKENYMKNIINPLIKKIYDNKYNVLFINELLDIFKNEEEEEKELLKKEEEKKELLKKEEEKKELLKKEEEKKLKVIKKEEEKKELLKKEEEKKLKVIKKEVNIDNNDKKKKKKTISSTIKKLVWNTNIGEDIGKSKCMCCKSTDITQMSFHCGHIVAESNGGETIVSNLKPICQNCNSSMGIKNMEEFMKSLK